MNIFKTDTGSRWGVNNPFGVAMYHNMGTSILILRVGDNHFLSRSTKNIFVLGNFFFRGKNWFPLGKSTFF